MPITIQGQCGPAILQDGANQALRQGRNSELVVQELHGRFYEQAYRGNLYSGGMSLTSINAATFTSATTGATATPIVGIWNPSTSTVNAVVLQATLGLTLTALTATGGGPYIWMINQVGGVITTGSAPFNRKSLAPIGSQVKNMSGVALTGMSNNLLTLGGSALFGGQPYNVSEVATAAGFMTGQQASVENFDGSLIVPPGAVLALMATTTPVAHSAVSNLIWEEVPL